MSGWHEFAPSMETGVHYVSASTQAGPAGSSQNYGSSEMLIVMLVSACTFTSVLSTTMFNVVLPEIGRDFNVTPATLGWLFTAYSLIFAVATTFYGRLGDLYGIRRFLTIGIGIFSLGSALAALAISFESLLAARIFQATGAAAIPALGTATVFRVVPAERRGMAMGYMSAVIGTGAGLGPVIGGALADFLSWRALFLVPGALVLITPVLLKLLPPMEGRGSGSLDLYGGALVALSIGGLLVAVTNLERAGATSPVVFGPFIIFALVMVALVHRIRSREDAFIPKALLLNRNYVLLGACAVGMTMTAMGAMVTLPLLLDEVQGVRVGQIGLVMLPSAVTSAVLGPIGGKLADRFGSVVPLRMGLSSLVVGAFMLSSFGTSGSPLMVSILAMFFGAGMGLAGAPLLNSVSLVLPQSRSGMGIGLIHMVFLMGGSFGVAIKTAIIDAGGWQHDTITEDMDLSFRAQIRGWKFVYVPDAVAPAEVPCEMNSFKGQQFRWAKGSAQTTKKLWLTVLRANIPWKVKMECLFHLTNNFAYLFLVILAALQLPNMLLRRHLERPELLLLDVPLFIATCVSIVVFYLTTHRALYGSFTGAVRRLPLMMAVSIGLSINNARAVLEGLIGKESEFVRTPKHGIVRAEDGWYAKRYRANKKNIGTMIELAFGAYFVLTITLAVITGSWINIPFLVLFLIGFLYVGLLSLYQAR
jgi:EmrB/QacA subfamily drug resistance transporter